MSDHANEPDDDYYAILGVDEATADARAIRKAYLRQSLAHHPDKNADDPERAKGRFVRIGEAYEVLGDPARRAAYDRHRRQKRSSAAPFRPASHDNTATENYEEGGSRPSQEQQYQSYREAFDAAMAGLSEDELNAVLGGAALIGSIVGSLAGSRLLGKSDNPLLRSVGAVAGSRVAGRAAASAVAAAHRHSTRRAALDRDRRERIARGEEPPVDDEPGIPAAAQAWRDLAEATRKSVGQAAARFAKKSRSQQTDNM